MNIVHSTGILLGASLGGMVGIAISRDLLSLSASFGLAFMAIGVIVGAVLGLQFVKRLL